MKTACVLVLGFFSLPLLAQPGGNNNDLLVTLYTQVEALQLEVQNLRGMVEEQGFQLRRMETEQRERYFDLDQRMSELTLGGAPAPGDALPPGTVPAANAQTSTQLPSPGLASPPVPTGTSPASPLSPVESALGAPAPAAVPPMDELELYRTALNMLLEQSLYEESLRYFQSYIDTYPQGRLIANALYWQGEALILLARLDDAREVFSRVLTDYPQDPKAASAMLKLGVVYNQMGDRALANQTWREIATRYPESVSEINLARDYLNNQR